MAHPNTYTVEDWLSEYHPELEGKIPLEPGMVFWRTTSVIGEGDGYHVLYLSTGKTAILGAGVSTTSSDGSIRNEIETGLLKPVAVEDLPDDLQADRIEKMEAARDSRAELAEIRRGEGVDERRIEIIEAEREALDEALDDEPDIATDGGTDDPRGAVLVEVADDPWSPDAEWVNPDTGDRITGEELGENYDELADDYYIEWECSRCGETFINENTEESDELVAAGWTSVHVPCSTEEELAEAHEAEWAVEENINATPEY